MTNNLWETAERLRTVQSAHKRFITLWALDQAARLFDQQWATRQCQLASADGADVGPRNWKALYRGSVLDD